MGIFNKRSFVWWQIGLLKITVLAIGLAIGANWSEVFAPYTTALIALAVVLGLYLAFVWFKQ